MLLPYIDPVIFSIGPFALRWYSIAWLTGGIYVLFMLKASARQSKYMTSEQAEDLVVWAFLGTMLGGRIGYTFFYGLEQLVADPLWLFKVWEGGMSFHGGLIGAVLVIYWWTKKHDYSFLKCLDMGAPHIPVALGLVRLTNFINQELWGRATDLPWGVIFPSDSLMLTRHPSQLYEAILEGLCLWLALHYAKNFSDKWGPGFVTGLGIGLYALARFTVEFVREPDDHLGLGLLDLTRGQWLSIPLIFLAMYLLIKAYRKS